MPEVVSWRVKPGITPIYLKGSSVFLSASPFKFSLTSAADPSGMVRRGWPLLPLHFWAWVWLGGQRLEPSWDQELQDCRSRRCLGSFRGRRKKGSGEVFRDVPEGSYTLWWKLTGALLLLPGLLPPPQAAGIRCGHRKLIAGFTVTKQLQWKIFFPSKNNTPLKQGARNYYEFKKGLKSPCPGDQGLRQAAGSNQAAVG